MKKLTGDTQFSTKLMSLNLSMDYLDIEIKKNIRIFYNNSVALQSSLMDSLLLLIEIKTSERKAAMLQDGISEIK